MSQHIKQLKDGTPIFQPSVRMRTVNQPAESGKSFGVERKIACLRLKNRLAQKKTPFSGRPFPVLHKEGESFG
ncbi:hypothetical protein HMPREF9441_02560 [Paraprevotella clara YIT 11840]|uniref:Uncharacterized protein n=1 Tax=Paraprevotella clara YIT 11840 TaxID=762968 RepID=G5ST60_9BACT|nr:hypothetical protein HMPREF9441_02560 [Paraprevotella clara YIT 11840]